MVWLASTETEIVGLSPLSASVSAVVAILAAILAVLAYRASRRKTNPSLAWVAIAFGLFAVKNLFSAVNVLTHIVKHDAIELVLSIFDLLLLVLLFTPLVLRRRR